MIAPTCYNTAGAQTPTNDPHTYRRTNLAYIKGPSPAQWDDDVSVNSGVSISRQDMSASPRYVPAQEQMLSLSPHNSAQPLSAPSIASGVIPNATHTTTHRGTICVECLLERVNMHTVFKESLEVS
jgi:hypothetical protein